MYKKLFLFLLAGCSMVSVAGQTYFTTGGIRLGTDFGLTFKQRIQKKTTIEAILFTDDYASNNMGLVLLADKHRSIVTRNFNMFYGAGLAWKWEVIELEAPMGQSRFGIPIQAGIEFTVGRINLSWDYTPILYISRKSNASSTPGFTSLRGLSARYVFLNKKEGKRVTKKLKTPFGKRKK